MFERLLKERNKEIEQVCKGCAHYNFCRNACEHCAEVDKIFSLYEAYQNFINAVVNG